MGSDCGQDTFVRETLEDLREGFWLELGCGDPIEGSNTHVLEKELGWRGVSIDLNPLLTGRWLGCRNMDNVIVGDALAIDYKKVLVYCNAPKTIDYLSLDLEPPSITFEATQKIPFDEYKFKVITYEHDFYRGVMGDSTATARRDGAREFFNNLGYHRVSKAYLDTRHGDYSNLSASEDWYTYELHAGVEYSA